MTWTPPVRLAMVGCGQIARLHAERLKKDPRGQLIALYDPQRAAMEWMQREWAPHARLCTSLDELLRISEVDAAIVCTPTRMHFEHVRSCRERGWPILCEKPLADTRDRIEQLIAEVQSGPPLTVAYQRRHGSLYRTLRREVQSGRWGRVLAVASHNAEHWEQLQAIPGTWRDDPALNPGGYLGDAGSHKIDIIFHITGLKPVEVFAHGHHGQRHVEIVSTISAMLQDDTKRTIPLSMSFLGNAHHFSEFLHIVCERADFKLMDHHLWQGRENELRPVTDLEPESNPITGFLDMLVEGRANIAPAECARPVFQFTQGVLESVTSQRPVKV